ANEQVIDGKCWRHDGPDDPLVEKKESKQWFFKITEYAEELLEATDQLNWTESVKLAQKNWIGKSKGAEIDFKVDGREEKITVFTTRADTLYGATFLVLAPEHELVDVLTTADHTNEVSAYKKSAQLKTELERQAQKDKTGVFTGSYAINPINNQKIPIWVADYVLVGYGTGAIMAVPAHDERDHEFAEKFSLPILRVVENNSPDDECSSTEGTLINSSELNGLESSSARGKIIEALQKDGLAKEKINYRMNDWSVSRQRYWGAPIPIIHCSYCGPVLVPDEQLPVIIPELDDFAPSGDGRSALARATDWLKVKCPNCGKDGERETDTLDTYICSSWYMFRYMDPHNQEKIFDSKIVNKWSPVDFYNGGDHATAHLLYARFIGHFFHHIGLINKPEPFKQMLFNGKVTAADGTMFSKSKGNGVDPLEIIDQGYGADALRTYLMFAAPLELWIRWDPQGVPGAYRFLSRVWTLVQEFLSADEAETSPEQATDLRRIANRTIKKVTNDLEHNDYNTAIAACMRCVNDLYKQKAIALNRSATWQEVLEAVVALIAPFAPHIAEELWHELGHSLTVHKDTWPKLDEKYLVSDRLTIVVQVNGKLKGEISVSVNTPDEEIKELAKALDKVAAVLSGASIKKTIYVPGKIVNFVI
ncbi:MAG TPA: class I tRNA ligase family protein, partial [Candidatus Saccharimonadales bacterium]|nr:class I tRNA ligase family protein [Candidatus Saccharimonadales bacterium]